MRRHAWARDYLMRRNPSASRFRGAESNKAGNASQILLKLTQQ